IRGRPGEQPQRAGLQSPISLQSREKGVRGPMAYENLIVEQEGAALYVTVNRPRVLNALNRATLAELEQVLEREAAGPDVRVVVIRGAGDRAFVAGADIQEMKDLSPHEFYRFMLRGHEVFHAVARLPKPTVAVI